MYTYDIRRVVGVYTPVGVVTEWLWSVHSKLECTLRQGKGCYTVNLKGAGTKMRQVADFKTASTSREFCLEKNVRSILKFTVCIRNYEPFCTCCKSKRHSQIPPP